jgi:hypothetical protein
MIDMGGFVLLATGASLTRDTSIFHPVSPAGDSIRSLFILALAVTGVIFVLVEGVLLTASSVSRAMDLLARRGYCALWHLPEPDLAEACTAKRGGEVR